jgi:SAM-dependent methyltransferase
MPNIIQPLEKSARYVPARADSARIQRLNWGCGPNAIEGWLNSDRHAASGIDIVGDILHGLPIESSSIDYIVAVHVLQDLTWGDIPPALREVLRILKPGGYFRLAVPDIDRAIDAYRRGDAQYFHVPNCDAQSVGAKFITQIIWYGSVRTPCTFDFVHESLESSGFVSVLRCRFGETASPHAEITALDNRERESLFVEAQRPAGSS